MGLESLIAPFLPYIFGAVAILLGLLGFGWKKKREGRKEMMDKSDKEALRREQTRTEIDRSVNNASDDERRRMRDKYTRP